MLKSSLMFFVTLPMVGSPLSTTTGGVSDIAKDMASCLSPFLGMTQEGGEAGTRFRTRRMNANVWKWSVDSAWQSASGGWDWSVQSEGRRLLMPCYICFDAGSRRDSMCLFAGVCSPVSLFGTTRKMLLFSRQVN